MKLSVVVLAWLIPGAAFAADYSELKAGVAIKLTKETIGYDLDTARHPFRKKDATKWNETDETSPVAFLGIGLKRRRLPAGTEGVLIKDSYVRITERNRTSADCAVVFQVGDRHFLLLNSDSIIGDDLTYLTKLVRTFPTVAILPTPSPMAQLEQK